METAGHQKVTRPLRRALDQHGGLDLEEPRRAQVVADGLGEAVPKREVAVHHRPAEIEVPVREPERFIHLDLIGDRKRRRLRRVQDAEIADPHLDLAGGNLWVDRSGRPRGHAPPDGHDVLAPHLSGGGRGGGRVLGSEDHLGDALAVAQIDEDETPEIAPGLDPPHQRDLPPHIRAAEAPVTVGPPPVAEPAGHARALCAIRDRSRPATTSGMPASATSSCVPVAISRTAATPRRSSSSPSTTTKTAPSRSACFICARSPRAITSTSTAMPAPRRRSANASAGAVCAPAVAM